MKAVAAGVFAHRRWANRAIRQCAVRLLRQGRRDAPQVAQNLAECDKPEASADDRQHGMPGRAQLHQ